MTSEVQESLLPVMGGQLEMLEEATATYEMELAVMGDVLAQLEARGLSRTTIAGARLGVVSDPPFPGHMGGWLAIPYLDRNGVPLTMRFRCIAHPGGCKAANHSAKYMSISGDPMRTYNVGALHRAERRENGDGRIHICEGELDALVLEQIGLHAIAIPGSEHWKPRHRKMLAGFDEVWIWADPDEGGRKLASSITKSVRRAKIVRLTDGDVGETFLARGAEHLLSLLA